MAYVRVSTEKQADHGVSLEAQNEKITAYAKLYELELVDVYVDAGESASSLDRPGLKMALGAIRAGRADALLVVKLDRLTRSVADLGELVDDYFAPGKAALLSVSEQIDTRSAAGKLVLNVLTSVSQWERETIGERTSVAMQHKKSKGEYTGGDAPYGYMIRFGPGPDEVGLEPTPEEQAVIAAARTLRGEGFSLRGVARELAQLGYRSRVGKAFAAKQVARMLEGGC